MQFLEEKSEEIDILGHLKSLFMCLNKVGMHALQVIINLCKTLHRAKWYTNHNTN